ncbi:DUF2491 family protein [Maridesulfovibrio zosterae]|uniref:DUF2491 family protein n=1 Tax=Maridesulfovibrio zosterae TaxID=82171 RepID=UPI000400A1B2|nr:DUF2491 family protein [Maridesulfovibrio zosterae]
MSSWKTIGRVLKNKISEVRKSSEHDYDEKIPLGMHIGGKVGIDTTTFLLYGDKLITAKPASEYYVIGHGIVFIEGERVDRIYLSTGKTTEAVLELMSGAGEETYEARFYIPFDRVYPQSDDEWAFWLDENEGYIGWEAFELKDILFSRLWMPGPQRVKPLELKEKLQIGSEEVDVTHETMIYGRSPDENEDLSEYVLVELSSSVNEDFISIMTGVDMIPTAIRVMY